MRKIRNNAASRATLPIWLMVVLAVGVCGVVLGMLAFTLAEVRQRTQHVGRVRATEAVLGQWAGNERRENQTALRDLLQGRGRSSDVDDTTPEGRDAAIEALVSEINEPRLVAAIDAWREADTAVESCITEAANWADDARRLSERSAAIASRTRECAFAVRAELLRLRGKQRLALVRAKDENARAAFAASTSTAESVLVELLDLLIRIDDLKVTFTQDAIRDFRLNVLLPSLDRLSDSGDTLALQLGEASSIPPMVQRLRSILLGTGDSQGLDGLLQWELRSRAELARINAGADSASKAETLAYDIISAEVEHLLSILRDQSVADIRIALQRSFSLAAAVVACLILIGAALARRTWTVTNELAGTVDALRESRAQLVDIAELRAANARAEAASRAKSDFLATMSHEIRTPLNGVVGTLDLLAGTTLTTNQTRYVQIGKTSASSLLSVISDILDFSKIEAGRLELSPVDCDLHALAVDVMRMCTPRAAEQRLEVECCLDPSVPRRVHIDPHRLRQILLNLINNAIKFTPRGSVTLRVVPALVGPERSLAGVRFSVVDTGIGIPPDRLDRLFKPFSQSDASMTRKYGGTGLGLAICKQLAELMQGAVGVTSEPGRGSTFWCEIATPPALGEPPAIAAAPDLRAARVLVVDDHRVFCESVLAALTSRGIAADAAFDGEEGLRKARDAADQGRPYSIVLLDYEMPGLDGAEVAAVMRADPRLRGTPLVLVSSALDLDADRVRAAGFLLHRIKPISSSDLMDDIATALAGSGSSAPSPQAPEVPPPVLPATGDERIRILIAEDNEINQLIACEMLTKSGFHCQVAGNGREAVDAVFAGDFDLVLMDCQMPEMDGFEAAKEIRRRESAGERVRSGTAQISIIALTANALAGDRERCLDAGMDDFISKPIDLVKLLAAIKKVLSPSTDASRAA